jgi:hypothetical protein
MDHPDGRFLVDQQIEQTMALGCHSLGVRQDRKQVVVAAASAEQDSPILHLVKEVARTPEEMARSAMQLPAAAPPALVLSVETVGRTSAVSAGGS